MFTIIAKNTIETDVVLSDLYSFTITVSGVVDLLETFNEVELARSNDLVANISNGNVVINNGSRDLDASEGVRYVSLSKTVGPITTDGKPIVRSDTRPIGTQTYFTMTGDDLQTGKLGAGDQMRWDFSNEDNMYDPNNFENPIVLASGIKAKYMEMKFTSPAYLKDGALFFFDAPWGAYASMYIVVPAGTYYPHPNGSIPASALGLSGDSKYEYSTKRVFYASYLNNHFMYKDCSRGVNLDAEGSQVDPVPSGWLIAGLVCCPEDDNTFKGFGLIEMYRQTIGLL